MVFWPNGISFPLWFLRNISTTLSYSFLLIVCLPSAIATWSVRFPLHSRKVNQEVIFIYSKGNNELTAESLTAGFNPSKTFGGDRAKMMFSNKVDYDDFNSQKKEVDFSSNNTKEDPFKKNMNMTNSNQAIIPAL